MSRLRKYLRTHRVTAVSQVGTDRIIEFQFSNGQYRLFFEFYAEGNILLTNNNLEILALLRIVPESQNQEELRKGLKYSLEKRQNYGGIPPLTKERVKDGLQDAITKEVPNNVGEKRKTKHKKKAGDPLRRALGQLLNEFPPMLIDHAFQVKGFDAATPLEEAIKEQKLDELMEVLHEAKGIFDSVAEASKGYIIAKPRKTKPQPDNEQVDDFEVNKENIDLLYEDFHPFRPQLETESGQVLEFDGFNRTVDEFFSSIESQKLESRLTEKEEHARRKIEAARLEHQRRLGGLQQVQELNVRKAQAIEGSLEKVQEVILAMNSLIAQGMDWWNIARLIERERGRQNPVAELIKLPLKLYENTVTVLLAEGGPIDEEDFEGDETDSDVSDGDSEDDSASKSGKNKTVEDKRLAVDVDLGMTAWANAGLYYDQQKSAAVKEQKTLKASTMALKSTEKKITADLKKGLKQEKEVLRPVRKAMWFEKFFYFISSEGYLVLGGRDAQQHETLYRKYLSKGDIYVHAELQGAAPLIVKNKPDFSDSPIPPSTLSQAGTFSIVSSTAWDSKAVMAAWWVKADQVSKTASTGEYLSAGIFMIHGQKNYLPAAHLLLGFGVMFRISEESKVKHMRHRIQDNPTKASQVDGTVDNFKEISTDAEEDGMESQKEDELDMSTSQPAVEADQTESGDEAENDADSQDDPDSVPMYSNPLQTNAGSTAISESEDEDDHSDLEVAAKTSHHGGNNDKNSASETEDYDVNTVAEGLKDMTTNEDIDVDRSTVASQRLKQAPQVRGKHGKKAKIKAKYADQDEEDRALALRLLGSTTGQQKTKSEAEDKAARDAELLAQKERRRQQHMRTQQQGKEAEELRKSKLEEGGQALDEDEVAELKLLDTFVGTPLPGDEILDCLAVCAPWDAMGARFRWRVKIQPGAQKKGKAVREILGAWGKSISDRQKKRMPEPGDERHEEEKLLMKEAELIKGLKDTEVVGIVPVSKMRLMMSGGGGDEKGRGGKGGGGGGKKAGKGNRGGKGSKKVR